MTEEEARDLRAKLEDDPLYQALVEAVTAFTTGLNGGRGYEDNVAYAAVDFVRQLQKEKQ